MKKIDAVICIGGGKSQLPLIKEVVDLDLALIVIDKNKHSPGFVNANESIQLSTFESQPILKRLKILEKKYNFIGIVNRSSGIPVITTSEIASYLRLPNIDPNMARMIVNKDLLRQHCKKNNILIPEYNIINKNDYPDRTPLKYPIIAKPSLSMVGKSGVSIVKNNRELKTAIVKAKKFSLSETALLESYIDGIDIELIGFVKDGLLQVFCMVEEINLIRNNGEIFGRGMKVFDQKTNSFISKLCIDASKDVIDSFKIIHSPFMGAFRVNKSGAYLIEVHLDIGGDLLLEKLLPYALSCNYAELILSYCIDIELKYQSFEALPSAILFDEGSKLVNEKGFNFLKANTFSELDKNIERIIN